jgi:hypothetical protein
VDSTGEEISQLKRVLVRWIAEAQSVGSPVAESAFLAAEAPDPVSAPPAKKAVELAVALISDLTTNQPSADHQAEHPVKGPAAA